MTAKPITKLADVLAAERIRQVSTPRIEDWRIVASDHQQSHEFATAHRESAETLIASLRAAGYVPLAMHWDGGGYHVIEL